MKKISVSIFIFLSGFFVILLSVNVFAASQPILSITGAVKQPLNLTVEDINSFQSIRVQLNDVMKDGEFKGVFYCQGVPLKTLLEFSSIDKGKTDFSKSVDLAILIRNSEGRQVVLSWGEVFYRNPGEIVLATSAYPIMPHKDCSACHSADVYEPWLSQLKRSVGFPRLVMAGDIYAERSIEEVTSIEVVDLKPKITGNKSHKLFSSGFAVTGTVEKPLIIKKISGYPQKEIHVKVIGEGKGYHGTKRFKGTPLLRLFEEAKIGADINTVFLVSAPDGYRSLLSYGELLFSPAGERIIVADSVDGQPIKKGGLFCLILPDDLMADRWVKAVNKIEVISFKK